MTETPPPVDFIAQAELIHTNGPAVTPPSTLFFTYLKPDGESVVAKATNAEQYLRLGYTITGQQTIESIDDLTTPDAPVTASVSATKAKADEDEPAPAAHKGKS